MNDAAAMTAHSGAEAATEHASARPEPYISRFGNWDRRASVRTKPGRRLDPAVGEQVFFPPELAPEAVHPLVQGLGPDAAGLILLHRLYGYLDFTSELEASTVIPVATAIARGRGGFAAPPAMQADAFKIVTDEAWHAQFSDGLVRQVEGHTGVCRLAQAPAFRSRLDRLMDGVDPALRAAGALAIAICSETLISSLLATMPNDTRLPSVVSATVRDHAEDEGRHHAYFRSVLGQFWPTLSPGERRALGPLLPDITLAFLEPDYPYIRRAIVAAGLSRSDAVQVVAESYPRTAVWQSCFAAARSTVRYFTDIGALDDTATRERFLASGLRVARDAVA